MASVYVAKPIAPAPVSFPLMQSSFDTIIVGAGLAGACAALHLSRRQRVLVLEAVEPAAGASGVAAGLVNPFMGRRARPVWRFAEALDTLEETFALADASLLYHRTGVLRPAADAKQATFFRETAAAYPTYTTWNTEGLVREHFPAVTAPHGALLVRMGGGLDGSAFVGALLEAASALGAEIRAQTRVYDWKETNEEAVVEVAASGRIETISARRVLLCIGGDYAAFPELAALNLHSIKGQLVRVAVAADSPLASLPPLAGAGYIVPEDRTRSLVVGSSYEHDFSDLRPSPVQTRLILKRAARMLPELAEAEVLDEKAGARVTVPGTRLPMLGPLPGRRRLWLFTGLGSKGLLMAPLLAKSLPRYFDNPSELPGEVRVRDS